MNRFMIAPARNCRNIARFAAPTAARPAGRFPFHIEVQLREVEGVDEGIDHAHRIVARPSWSGVCSHAIPRMRPSRSDFVLCIRASKGSRASTAYLRLHL
jgi:hypothetical protein